MSALRFSLDTSSRTPAIRAQVWRYAPIILVLKTETEFHDRMRDLLLHALSLLKGPRVQGINGYI